MPEHPPSDSEIPELLNKLDRLPAHGATFGFGHGSVKTNVWQFFNIVLPITELKVI